MEKNDAYGQNAYGDRRYAGPFYNIIDYFIFIKNKFRQQSKKGFEGRHKLFTSLPTAAAFATVNQI